MAIEADLRKYLKKAYVALEAAQGRLYEHRQKQAEPIAIVGIACRFPGGISSPEDLWRVVIEGRDVMSGFPQDRGWDFARLFDSNPRATGTSYVREGAFLDDACGFDAEFFGIPPIEAREMDPQHRVMLEIAWEAIERAMIDPASLRGSRTGVFVGMSPQGYEHAFLTGRIGATVHSITGTTPSICAGRISYALGLEGPAYVVDTACSSSLSALHLACQSLKNDECALALAGGVTVLATPASFVGFSALRAMARDGRCKSFAAGADGTGWGEGAGLVVLERLSDARRLGHKIWALVRGSAANQDGASNGLTAPNGLAQQRVIRAALADAQISACQVDVVEAHGTGTVLGDPIEARALQETYGLDRPTDRPALVGSIKSNLGHVQAAAGVAGVIKMVQAMQQAVVPPTLHVDAPTPHVDWSAGTLKLATSETVWPVNDHPRRAGVSSFGFSGTNVHVILEQAPREEQNGGVANAPTVLPLMLSARTEASLQEQAARLSAALADSELSLADVGYSLAATRTSFDQRVAVVGDTRTSMLEGLAAIAAEESSPFVLRGRTSAGSRTAILFSFPTSQRFDIAPDFRATFPAFATTFSEVCAQFQQQLGPPSQHVMSDNGELECAATNNAEFTRHELFAIGVGIFRLVESWGVRPDFVCGYGVGALAAGHVAGVFSLSDAVTAVADACVGADSPEPSGPLDSPRKTVDAITFRAPKVQVFSSALGSLVAPEELCCREYWVREQCNPGRFSDIAESLAAIGVRTILEIGSEGVTSHQIDGAHVGSRCSLIRLSEPGYAGIARVCESMAGYWADGGEINWRAVFAETSNRLVTLPTYAFQHRRFWPDATIDEPQTGSENGMGGIGAVNVSTRGWDSDGQQ